MIGERLLDLRKDAGLTQDELASILKINKHSISSYEREKSEPPDAIKIEIATYFNVSVDYLLGLTDNPNSYSNCHNILQLPSHFPPNAKNSLKDYADYLCEKYTGNAFTHK
jgi:transcriptional regulator with XRE-family HTH domain